MDRGPSFANDAVATVHERLRARFAKLAGAMAIMYALPAPAHLLVLDGSKAAVMAPTAAASVLVLIGLRQLATRSLNPSANVLFFFAVIVVTLNSALHQALDQRLLHTTNTAFLLIGIGACFLDLRWLLASYAVCLGSWAAAASLDRGDGEWLHFIIALMFATFMSVSIHVVRRDDEARVQRASAALAARARRDALTGLANRVELEERLSGHAASAARTGSPLSILICDLDGFKEYNDSQGHLRGDELLKRVAGELRESARRSQDVVARWGGTSSW